MKKPNLLYKVEKVVFINVVSDNHNGDLFTIPAYKRLVLEMSTGDEATHTAKYSAEYSDRCDYIDINTDGFITEKR